MSDELILAISGNDIFSGGGLHADLATFTTNKQHGFVALTCLTAMTENGTSFSESSCCLKTF